MQKTRRSRQREEILGFLRSTDSHPTAQQIYEAILKDFPSLSLGTVYRNLGILEDQGHIRKLQYGSTFDRYDADTGSHYHFICKRCGGVYDIELDTKLGLEELASRKSGHRHLIEEHSVDFYGICQHCLEKGRRREAS